jgi:Pyruvate/2-oxoacid:ferredoxin oxidoreductase delta subunit/DNA-binding Lrp family transcriptional regulator
MAEDVYLRLREFLDNMPGGYPETDSGVEIRILKRFFTPEQAEMTMHLTPMPEPVPAIAERAGMDEEAAAELLETLAKEGNIMRIRIEDQPYYMAISFVVGIYEFHLKVMDREFAEMMEEYLPYLTEMFSGLKTQQLRVVPVESAIETVHEVETYDRVRDLVKEHEIFAVADCICRKEAGLLGHPCDRPIEVCLTFGMAAQYFIENELGREISMEECLEVLDLAEESALVLSPTNAQDFVNICCCCSCCCNMLKGLKTFERPADYAGSSFQAKIDPDLCTSCGTCLDRCQIDAIIEGDEYNEVDLARCIGCGLCVPTCPEEAIVMVAKAEVEVPPKNIVARDIKLATERGVI